MENIIKNIKSKEESEIYNVVGEFSTIEDDVTVNKILMHILDVLVLEYKEQIKPVSLKNYIINKKETCFEKEISDKEIIEKYLNKLDFDFLSDLSKVFDLEIRI